MGFQIWVYIGNLETQKVLALGLLYYYVQDFSTIGTSYQGYQYGGDLGLFAIQSLHRGDRRLVERYSNQ